MIKEKIVIEKAKPEDAEEYNNFKNKMWRIAYKDVLSEKALQIEEAKTPKKISKFATDIENPDSHFYVAKNEAGKIVGIMTASTSDRFLEDYFKGKGYANLGALYIAPEYQGMGIGSMFRNKFEEIMKSKGMNKYVVTAFQDNNKARKVYEHWGGKLSSYKSANNIGEETYKEVNYEFEVK